MSDKDYNFFNYYSTSCFHKNSITTLFPHDVGKDVVKYCTEEELKACKSNIVVIIGKILKTQIMIYGYIP